MAITTRTWSSSRRRFSAALALISLVLAALPISSSIASRGGTEDRENRFAVAITYKDNGIAQLCSGALIAPKIVVTAEHCVTSHHGGPLTDYVITNPGVNIEDPVPPNPIMKVVKATEDLAFLVLSSSLQNGQYPTIADSDAIASLSDSAPLFGYGFGYVFEDFRLYSNYSRRYPILWSTKGLVPNLKSTYEVTSLSSSACSGDSGGPITTTINGKEVLIGVIGSAAQVSGTCGTAGVDGLFRMKITLIHPYLSLIPEYTSTAQPTISPTPKSTPTPRIKKITCIKGSKKVIVRGANPKCPKGYKAKK